MERIITAEGSRHSLRHGLLPSTGRWRVALAWTNEPTGGPAHLPVVVLQFVLAESLVWWTLLRGRYSTFSDGIELEGWGAIFPANTRRDASTRWDNHAEPRRPAAKTAPLPVPIIETAVSIGSSKGAGLQLASPASFGADRRLAGFDLFSSLSRTLAHQIPSLCLHPPHRCLKSWRWARHAQWRPSKFCPISPP